jgi:hypothetical protein
MSDIAQPRSFAGRKDASVLAFMTSYCTSLALGDDPAPYVEQARKIAQRARDRGAADLGAWLNISRDETIKDLDAEAQGHGEDWVLSIENILGMEFHVFTSQNVSDARSQGLINRSKREDRFKDEDDGSFGATMFAHNRLSEISFEYSDFPNVRTANPHLCVLSDWEFHYIKDIARLCVFRK